MEATTLAEEGVPRVIPWREDNRSFVRVLPVAAVFGANASGKTNLLRAMDDMQRLVATSFRGRARPSRHRKIFRRPFLLDASYERSPSRFEIDLVIRGVRYEYGFEIDDSRVVSEWARRFPKGKAATIFRREYNDVNLGENKSAKAKILKDLVRDDVLLISTAAALSYPPLMALNEWFETNLTFCAASSREARWAYTAHLLEHEDRREQVLDLLQIADLGITGARTRPADPDMVEKLESFIRSIHEGEDDSDSLDFVGETIVGFSLSHRGRRGSFELDSNDESLGTLVWLGLIGPLLDALVSGTVLLADELESSLHPDLVGEIVRLFQSPISNPNGAQLIFNSHEARLLGNSTEDRIIGRDQAWFAEKSNDGGTRLYPLTDFAPRKSEAIARRYSEGRYGATPILSHVEFGSFAAKITSDSD